MIWVGEFLKAHPELAVFLALGAGFVIGSVKLKGFGLGGSTGALVAGLLIGAFFDVPVSGTAKSLVFLLFLFSIGYEVGPKFAQAMKGDGWRSAVLGIFMPIVGLLAAWGVARFLGLDAGFAGGMVSGALTESPAMGMAIDAINGLPLEAAERERLAAHVPVADSVCYIFGAFGVIWMCGSLGPKLLRLNLREAAAQTEQEYGIEGGKPGQVAAWRSLDLRAFRLSDAGARAWRKVADLEQSVPDARLFVPRLRRGQQILDAEPGTELRAGDVIALSGPREVLVARPGPELAEVEDRELLDHPVTSLDVLVTSRDIAGQTMEALLARDRDALRGVYLRRVTRGGLEVPIGRRTVVERGDVLRFVGTEEAVEATARRVGAVVSASESTDFRVLGLATVAGAVVGVVAGVDWKGFHISLGTSVGVLLAGIVVGWLHSRRPLFGRVPEAALSFMQTLGLAAFVAMVGLGAGPHFVPAIREAGIGLLFGGMIVTMTPLVAGLYFGRYVLRMNPLLLLGCISGAQTFTPGLAAVQEKSGSPIAVLGYSGSAAIAHVLIPMWGSVIVWLVAGTGGGG